jgi:hypothetical protein
LARIPSAWFGVGHQGRGERGRYRRAVTKRAEVQSDQRRAKIVVEVGIGAVAAEVVGLVGYGIAIGWVAQGNGGGKVSAAPVLVALYLIFAALVALVGRGIMSHRHWARTPYLLVQVFGIIVAYTLARGTGLAPHMFAVVVGVVAVAGLGVGLSGPFSRWLQV